MHGTSHNNRSRPSYSITCVTYFVDCLTNAAAPRQMPPLDEHEPLSSVLPASSPSCHAHLAVAQVTRQIAHHVQGSTRTTLGLFMRQRYLLVCVLLLAQLCFADHHCSENRPGLAQLRFLSAATAFPHRQITKRLCARPFHCRSASRMNKSRSQGSMEPARHQLRLTRSLHLEVKWISTQS